MTAPDTIHVHTEGRTAWVTLDRPPLNILDIPMMHALGTALHKLTTAADVIVFQGAGEKGFSAGSDVHDHAPARVAEMLGAFHGIFRQLWRAESLTIAAVHGYCLGGGCELATFCDFVVAAESAQFGQPEIKLGCFPPVAVVTLPALVGPRVAMEMILTGRTLSAAEASRLGLVTRVVPNDAVSREVDALVAELRALSPAALRMSRRALRQRAGVDFGHSLHEAEELYLQELMKTEDAAEGIRAFLEKRAPVWRGR